MPLSERKTRKAGQYNRLAAERLGWNQHYPRMVTLFDLNPDTVTRSLFTLAVHDWQAAQTPPLTKDGKLGPGTWAKLQRELDQNVPTAPNVKIPTWLGGAGTQIIQRADVGGTTNRWFYVARQQQRRWAAELATWGPERDSDDPESELDWDEAYFVASPRWAKETHDLGQVSDKDDRAWCAAFANYCLHRTGYSHTGSAGANSFTKNWAWHFDALTEPAQGCVIVVGNADTAHGTHVAFLDTWDNLPSNPNGHVQNKASREFHLLGGNQRNGGVSSRRELVRAQSDLLAGRGRNGVTSPYLWPLQGPHNCTIGSVIPTEQLHHCHYIPKEN